MAEAYARERDPKTSWEAAESLDQGTIRVSQQLALSYLRSVGRAFVIEVEDALTAPIPGRSRARIRTACKELRELGLAEIAGYDKPPGSTRRAMILQPTRREEVPLCESGPSSPSSGLQERSAASHGTPASS